MDIDTVTGFRLAQNVPNPFRSRTTLSFELERPSEVRLEVLAAAGRHIVMLAEGRREAGTHTVTWDARDLASGIYIARLTAAGASAMQRMTLLRQ